MLLLRRLFRWVGRLFGLRERPRFTPDQLQWRELLDRYRAALAQIRESGNPDELELAHTAFLTVQAELQWQIRLAKRVRGLPLRSLAENHRQRQELIWYLYHGQAMIRSGGAAARRQAGRRRRDRS